MVAVSSWGRLGSWQHRILPLQDEAAVAEAMSVSPPGIAFGMGRSYGDVCLNPGGTLWSTGGLDHFLGFDRDTGVLECEAGVLLRDIQALAVPAGWMLPVTPGTSQVTLGGAIANDVHGKNHHGFGSFGDHVLALRLVRSDGEVLACGPGVSEPWFRATVGGMGLTGVISRASLQLRPVAGPWIDVETIPYHSLEEFYQLADESERYWEYTVSWFDCVARKSPRGIFFRGNHSDHSQSGADSKESSPAVPFTPPLSLVNRLTLRPLNWAYYQLHARRAGRSVSHYRPFFYPLDAIRGWNRIYGPRGFYQYQCVLPATSREAMSELLQITRGSRSGSFLAVLKTFGDRPAPGMMSFPCHGATLALDFPNGGDNTLKLLQRLDEVVRDAGGRLYPAKDARMPRELFESGYPALETFREFLDPGISSALSRRLVER